MVNHGKMHLEIYLNICYNSGAHSVNKHFENILNSAASHSCDMVKEKEGDGMECDDCSYYEWDDEDEAYYCSVSMDEDDYARLFQSRRRQCPYYRHDDEYQIVRHQM